MGGPCNSFFFLVKKVLDTANSLIIVLGFTPENINSLPLGVKILVQVERDFTKPSQLIILSILDVFLLHNEAFLILNFLPKIQIGHVL